MPSIINFAGLEADSVFDIKKQWLLTTHYKDDNQLALLFWICILEHKSEVHKLLSNTFYLNEHVW